MFHKMTSATVVLVCCLLMAGMAGAADPSLVGWWKLDDGSGTIAKDSSASQNDGTLNGTGVWVEGILGGALEFDGSTTYVEIPANINQAVINKGDFSMMAWIKTTDIAGTNYAFQQGDGNGTGRSWLFTVNGEITTYVGVGNFPSGVIVNLDEWYHAGFTVIEGGDSDILQMYVNGEPEGAQGTRAMETCEGGYFMGTHKGMATGSRWPGVLDDVRVYNRALTSEEIKVVMLGVPPAQSAGPVPANEAADVLRDPTLSWTPGEFASTHNVYLGESFGDVNDATVPTGAGLTVNSFDPGRLTFGQTYYWRVDEVNGTPDKTVYKGDVWSFTVEPYAIMVPVDVNHVTASSATPANPPRMVVNGSGLDGSTHSTDSDTMWLSATPELDPWLMFEFDNVQKLSQMLIWNSNGPSERFVGWGIKDVNIETSLDGVDWTSLGESNQISQAPGQPTYSEPQVIDLDLPLAKYVRLNILSNWGGLLNQYGVAEVQFYGLPVYARTPDPASGSTDVLPNSTVTWRAGREAGEHTVYVGPDAEALTSSVSSKTNSVDLKFLDLKLDQAYYWRVDEVNESEAPSVWTGDVWSFSTVPYVTVDDFESYGNLSPDRPFQTWLDGFGYSADEFFPVDYPGNGTGSGVGHDIWSPGSPYFDGTIMEGTIAKHGQSMPLYFNNTGGIGVSETTRTFDTAQDWTANGIQSLSLSIHGDPGNTGQLYLKINNTKIAYDGLSDALQRAQWVPWIVDLTQISGAQNVTSLTLGIEGAGATGVLYVDDIRLYGMAAELIAPVVPGNENLVAAWNFDEGSGTTIADNSGNGHTGTIVDATWDTGVQGSALLFPETGYVETGYAGITGTGSRTYAAWIKTTEANRTFMSCGLNTVGNKWRIRLNATGGLRIEVNGGFHYGQTYLADDEWHHTAVVLDSDGTPDCSETLLYVDGLPETTAAIQGTAIDTDPTGEFRIGMATYDTVGFIGLIDDARVYDRALSDGEIMGLAGITQTVVKPFE